MTDRERLLRFGKIKPLAWKFAWPSIISMVVFTLYNLVDRIYLGQIPGVGSLAMAGVGITTPVMTVVFALAMLLGVGSSTLISIKLGQKKPVEANRVFNNVFELVIIAAVTVMGLCWVLLKPILYGLGVDETLLPFAEGYLLYVTGGFLFANVGFFLVNCLRSIGHPKVATVCNVAGTVINLILDPVLIFGFKLGVQGAAVATVISQLVSCGVAVGFYYWHRNELVLKIKRPNWRLDARIIARVAKIGFAPFAMQLMNCVLLILLNNLLVSYGGNAAVAMVTILMSIQALVTLPMLGYVQGQQPIIGFNYGAKAYQRVRETLFYALKVSLVFGVVGEILVQLWPQILIRAFTNDVELIAASTVGLRIFMGIVGLLGIRFVAAGFFQAVGNAKLTTILNLSWAILFLIWMLVGIPLTVPRWGLTSVWVGSLIGDGCALGLAGVLLWRAMKRIPLEDEDESEQEEVLLDVVECGYENSITQ